MSSSSAYDRLLAALGGRISRREGQQARAQCPAHDGQSRDSLALRVIDGMTLVHCHGGCATEDVLAALNLTMADMYDERTVTYRYDDGRVVHRRYNGTQRRFTQTGNTRGTAQLYRAAAVAEAIGNGVAVAVVEGEKDCHALASLGAVATTNPMGAANWHKVDPSPLYGGRIMVIPDADDAGRNWAHAVRASLAGKCESLTFLAPKVGKDPADHIAAGHRLDEFIPLTLGDDESTENQPTRRIRLTPATTIRMRPVRWTWDTAPADAPPSERQGRFPEGSLVLAVGRAGLGKSQFAIWMTARITTGTLPGACFGRPRAVVYAASEDSWSMTIVPRLVAAGADLAMVFRIDVESDDDPHATLTLPRDTSLLETELVSHGVALVVLDPLLSLIDQAINDYRAREVRQALEPLVAVADRTRATFLGLAHFTKSTSSDPLMLISGSGAFGQLIRAAIGFARDEEVDDVGSYVLSTIKNNLGREDLPSLAYVIRPYAVDTPDGETWVSRLELTGEESSRSVRDLLRDRFDTEDRTERDEAERWLVSYLTNQGGAAAAGEVIKAATRDGIAKTTLTKARHRARIETSKTGMSGGWVWTLPGTTRARRIPEETEEPPAQEQDSSVPSATALPLDTRPCGICGTPFQPDPPSRAVCDDCRPHLVGTRTVDTA